MDERAFALEVQAFQPISWRSRWQHFFLLATGILATTILLKVVAIQWLELIYLAHIAFVFGHFLRNNLRATWFLPYVWLGTFYAIFMVAALGLSVASLRFTFYMPPNEPLWVYPVYITVSRVVELFASSFVMLWLADLFRQQTNKLRFTMRVYFWTGVASAVYSYISYFIDISGGPMLGSYLVNHRFRGFYNEGGPYGLYLMTVIFLGVALYKLQWESVLRMRVGLALLPVAFYRSYSKAAFTAILVVLLINGLFTRGFAKRLALLSSLALVTVFAFRNANLDQVVALVSSDASYYERESHLHVGDANFVLGRIAARFIIPRMIAAHPLTGIGWGNYGILRNDPQYRGASVWSDVADNTGLGVLGYAAEIGLPLLTFLIVLLFLPYFYLRARRCPTWLTNLALMSPLVHLCGAQLNVTYPWVVTAFALALCYVGEGAQKLQVADAPVQLSWKQEPVQLGSPTQN